MKSDFQKAIFLAVIIGLAFLHVQTGLDAEKSPAGAEPVLAYQNAASPFVSSIGSGAEADSSGNTPQNSSGVVAPPQDLAFFRVESTLPPAVSAAEALVGDLRSGTIYFATSSGSRWPLASLTKLMSASLISERMNATNTVTLTQEDLVDGDYASIFTPDSTYAEGDLFKAMLVGSSNESAKSLARTLGGDSFVDDMNKRAADWGLSETHFKDPAGISAANQSSAEDVFKMVAEIYGNYPQIFKTTQNSKVTISAAGSKVKQTIQNTHKYAGRSDFLGGKTGTTPEAGENLVTIISYGKREVVIIVMGAEDRYADTDQLIQWFKNDFSPGY
jgi:D-alanyl-D-alanine carboxypeptidase